jgi:hypothetical protein
VQVTIQGSSLSPSAAVTFGGTPCVIVAVDEWDPTSFTCITGSHAAGTVAITYDGVDTGLTFTYSAAFTPAVVTFAPTFASAAVSEPIVVSVTNAGAAVVDLVPQSARVSFTSSAGQVQCLVQSVSAGAAAGDIDIACVVVRGDVPAAPQPTAASIAVTLLPFGRCDTAAAPSLNRRFFVASVSPTTVGVSGGAVLTVTGTGFSTTPGNNKVVLSAINGLAGLCVVSSSTETSLTCTVVTNSTPPLLSPSMSTRRLLATASAVLPGGADGHAEEQYYDVAEDDVHGDHTMMYLLQQLYPDGVHRAPIHSRLHASLGSASGRRMLMPASAATTVAVVVNDVESVCSGACDLALSSVITPSITSVTGVAIGGVAHIDIRGTLFGAAGDSGAGIDVRVGEDVCAFNAAQSSLPTKIVCALAPRPASIRRVTVNVQSSGGQPGPGFADGLFNYTFPLTTTSLSPSSGSTQGALCCVTRTARCLLELCVCVCLRV